MRNIKLLLGIGLVAGTSYGCLESHCESVDTCPDASCSQDSSEPELIVDAGHPDVESDVNFLPPEDVGESEDTEEVGTPILNIGCTDLADYPDCYVTNGRFNGFFVVGERSYSVDNLAAVDIATNMQYTDEDGNLQYARMEDVTRLDSEIEDITAQNLIVIGLPCVNLVAAELLEYPQDCAEGFSPGQARIKLFPHETGYSSMLVAGYSGADTRMAGKVLAHSWQELSGDEVVIEGDSF